MLWTTLLDRGFDKPSTSILKTWDAYLTSLEGGALGPNDTPDTDTVLAQLAGIREHDWFDLAVGEDFSLPLYCGALSRLHRRSLPLSIPMFEVWAALRLLAKLPTREASELLDEVLEGSHVCVLAINSIFEPGYSGWVPLGADTMVLLAESGSDGVAIHLIKPGDGNYEPANGPDRTLPSVLVDGRGTKLGELSASELERVRAELLVSQAAALAGQAESLLIDTATYLGVREQFGVPIGSFQALQHRAADLAVEIYAAHRMSRHAAEHLEGHTEPLALGLLAKAFVASAALRMGSEAVQLHGGIGFTWGGGLHFGLKRIMQLAMTGPTVVDCEEQLGEYAITSDALVWAGGIEAAAAPDTADMGGR